MTTETEVDQVDVPVWGIVVVVLAIAVLFLMLWSAQRGRRVHLRNVGKVGDNLREALPSIVNATHGHLMDGNKVEILQNGDGFWPRLLEDIAAAQSNIHFESYVWWKGDICRQVAEALAAKARQGVEVRVLLDWSGSSRMDEKLLELMRDAGVEVAKYRPPRFSNLARMNSRDHRKLMVVDGKLGYVFGHGVADQWIGNAQDGEHWRDTGARMRGPRRRRSAERLHRELGGRDRRGDRGREVLSDPRQGRQRAGARGLPVPARQRLGGRPAAPAGLRRRQVRAVDPEPVPVRRRVDHRTARGRGAAWGRRAHHAARPGHRLAVRAPRRTPSFRSSARVAE